MAYGQNHYTAAYNDLHNKLEYPGYNSELVLGRTGDNAYYRGNDYSYYNSHPSYGSHYQYSTPSGHSSRIYQGPSGSRSEAYAHREWSQAPMTLAVPLCCHDCKVKLEKSLRKVSGVQDVDIRGSTPARVIVTGTANPEKILKSARKHFSTADWMDSFSRETCNNHATRHSHWWKK